MIFFRSTIAAKDAHIADLQARLDASEAERKALLDRLLQRNNFAPIAEQQKPVNAKPALQFIAPPGLALPEIQDAMRDVWLKEESDYLMHTLGYDEERAIRQAAMEYERQNGVTE